MKTHAHHRTAGRIAGMALAGVLFGLPVSATAAPNYSDWFGYGAEAAAAWEFIETPDEPLRLTIRRKGSGEPSFRVMVIYPRPSSAYDIAITKVLDVFDEKGLDIEFTVINFDRTESLGHEALEVADAGDYDLIYSMGSESTAWMWDNYRGGAVPVVSICSKDPVLLEQASAYDVGTGTNFAFTSLNTPIEVQMAYLLELKPELRNLAILVDSQNVSAVQTQAEPIARLARRRGVQVFDVAVRDPQNARRELGSLVSSTVDSMRRNDPTLDHSVFWVTGSTSVFREIRTINENSDRAPVLSVVPEVVAAGDDSAVLSIGVSFQSNAHIAAIYGADVLLERAIVGDMPVGVVSPPDIAINFRKARAIGLNVPFSFLESASTVYDYEGHPVRVDGKSLVPTN
ncbi:MAG: hypothetical protein HKM95_01695 [Inquilinus sp.]|nr:hypothetical protein [Inquilinus sp.]